MSTERVFSHWKGLDTPTKWMPRAGIGLGAVSLVYLIARLTSDRDDP